MITVEVGDRISPGQIQYYVRCVQESHIFIVIGFYNHESSDVICYFYQGKYFRTMENAVQYILQEKQVLTDVTPIFGEDETFRQGEKE